MLFAGDEEAAHYADLEPVFPREQNRIRIRIGQLGENGEERFLRFPLARSPVVQDDERLLRHGRDLVQHFRRCVLAAVDEPDCDSGPAGRRPFQPVVEVESAGAPVGQNRDFAGLRPEAPAELEVLLVRGWNGQPGHAGFPGRKPGFGGIVAAEYERGSGRQFELPAEKQVRRRIVQRDDEVVVPGAQLLAQRFDLLRVRFQGRCGVNIEFDRVDAGGDAALLKVGAEPDIVVAAPEIGGVGGVDVENSFFRRNAVSPCRQGKRGKQKQEKRRK